MSRRATVVLALVALCLGSGCGAETPLEHGLQASEQSQCSPFLGASSPTAPYRANQFGLWFLMQESAARQWLVDQGERQTSRVTNSGATRSNAFWEAGTADQSGAVPELAIEAQGVGADLIAGGLAQILMNPDDDTHAGEGSMLDQGLKAIEWGLAQRSKTEAGGIACNNTNHPDTPPYAVPDSWPCERGGTKSGAHSLHPKTMFVNAAASGLELILAAGVDHLPTSYVDRAQSARAQLVAVGHWLASQDEEHGDVREFRRGITRGGTYQPEKANFNQQLLLPVALFKVGRLAMDPILAAIAQDWMENDIYGVLKEERVVNSLSAASVLPENAYAGLSAGLDGFDASYQTFSIEMLTDYVGSLPEGDAFRDQRLLPTLQRAYARFDEAVVQPDGSTWQVDGARAHNTRTCECGPRADPGEPTMPIRMVRYGVLTGTLCGHDLHKKAIAVLTTAQTFTHYQDCSSEGRNDGDLCVDPH